MTCSIDAVRESKFDLALDSSKPRNLQACPLRHCLLGHQTGKADRSASLSKTDITRIVVSAFTSPDKQSGRRMDLQKTGRHGAPRCGACRARRQPKRYRRICGASSTRWSLTGGSLWCRLSAMHLPRTTRSSSARFWYRLWPRWAVSELSNAVLDFVMQTRPYKDIDKLSETLTGTGQEPWLYLLKSGHV